MREKDISSDGPSCIYKYCSEQFNPFDSHGKVQLAVTIEQSV